MQKLIVFTDLDGSLLEHNTYSWEAAKPALQKLEALKFPVILNSSKTSEEIQKHHQQMNLTTPYICENGAVIHLKNNSTEHRKNQPDTLFFAQSYRNICQILEQLRLENNYRFTGFSDMTEEQLMKLTDLDRDSATAALKREATEPLLWQDSKQNFEIFQNQLTDKNLQLTRGGRFYHVMSPVNKGDAIKYIIDKYQQAEPATQWLTAGLGDSYNDIPMLEQVDYPVLISNPDGSQPDTHHINNLIITDQPGPAGWNKAVFKIILNITGKNHG